MTIEVAYGVPASVTDEQLLAALRIVNDNFDEAPTRMHCVLGPPGLGVRWFSFACTSFGRDLVLAENHFSESIDDALPGLLVATRGYTSVDRFQRRGDDWLTLVRRDRFIVVVRGTLPPTARRDGDVDEVALAALGLPNARPFEALREPTHQVELRVDRTRVGRLAITKLDGPVLPVKVNPARGYIGDGPHETFPIVDRIVDPTDASALAAEVERVSREIEAMHIQKLDKREFEIARKLAAHGEGIATHLIAKLAQPKPRPRTSRICLLALGMLGRGAEAIVPWTDRGASLADAAYAALARMGEAARPALVSARTSKKKREREAADVMLRLLDDPRFAPLREVRASRDALAAEVRASIAPLTTSTYVAEGLRLILDRLGPEERPAAVAWFMQASTEAESHNWTTGVCSATRAWPEVAWAFAVFVLETPLPGLDARTAILKEAAAQHGAEVGPIADVLLGFPPLAGDATLAALAAGRKPPTWSELLDQRRKQRDAKKKTAAKPKPKPKVSKKR